MYCAHAPMVLRVPRHAAATMGFQLSVPKRTESHKTTSVRLPPPERRVPPGIASTASTRDCNYVTDS